MAPTSIFKKLEKRTPNVVPVFVFINLVLTVLILFVLFFQGASLFSLSRKPTPALVQMVNGKSILAESVDWEQRTDATIHNFIQEILPLLRWQSEKLPKEFTTAEENKLVRVPMLRDIQVPRINYIASFALSDGFGKAYLQSLASLNNEYRQRGVKEVVLQISTLFPPRRVGSPREWTVDVIAALKLFGEGNELLDIESYNNRIHLQAVLPPKFVIEPTPAERLVNGIRTAGLVITLIEPLKE
ncbi:hypothetical protein [aff. Roholtiella sp. LEGE 12411]|uniref:hypothetical protein n=1 Tax=aff. Roholtiella sp. LEGE 12411 TaxID=1828822 RepID=UPI00187F7FF6|nr:hypothetical protein [aff. Roholtiella sp. LEGE 12411]MBE9035199.1 hypothetical protein [aff. Roholtiella sp. LEGE 12411]